MTKQSCSSHVHSTFLGDPSLLIIINTYTVQTYQFGPYLTDQHNVPRLLDPWTSNKLLYLVRSLQAIA